MNKHGSAAFGPFLWSRLAHALSEHGDAFLQNSWNAWVFRGCLTYISTVMETVGEGGGGKAKNAVLSKHKVGIGGCVIPMC